MDRGDVNTVDAQKNSFIRVLNAREQEELRKSLLHPRESDAPHLWRPPSTLNIRLNEDKTIIAEICC